MNVYIAILIVVIGGVIGIIVDIRGTIEKPAFFWFLGWLTGFLSTVFLVGM
jgi:hypothetical protein